MKQFYMPSLGDTMTLATDWEVVIANDRRNRSLAEWAGVCAVPSGSYSYYPLGPARNMGYAALRNVTATVTIPKGTVLRIDRIYLRKDKPTFNSLTFWAQIPGVKKKVRFFASLSDVNRMLIEDSV